MLRKAIIIILAILPISNGFASGLDLRLGTDAAELVYLTESATFGYGGADMGFGIDVMHKIIVWLINKLDQLKPAIR